MIYSISNYLFQLLYNSFIKPMFLTWILVLLIYRIDFVAFLNVGQGDMSIIKSGKTQLIIDLGRGKKESLMITALKGIDLDLYVLLTHPDNDHIGGFPYIDTTDKSYVKMKSIIVNKYFGKKSNAFGILENGNLVVVEDSSVLNLNGLELIMVTDPKCSDTNSCSIMSYIHIGNKEFHFLGDASLKAQTYYYEVLYKLINQGSSEYNELKGSKVGIFKFAHHCSCKDNNFEVMSDYLSKNVYANKFGICSYGRNSYGHPCDNFLEVMDSKEFDLLETKMDGSMVFLVNKMFIL